VPPLHTPSPTPSLVAGRPSPPLFVSARRCLLAAPLLLAMVREPGFSPLAEREHAVIVPEIARVEAASQEQVRSEGRTLIAVASASMSVMGAPSFWSPASARRSRTLGGMGGVGGMNAIPQGYRRYHLRLSKSRPYHRCPFVDSPIAQYPSSSTR